MSAAGKLPVALPRPALIGACRAISAPTTAVRMTARPLSMRDSSPFGRVDVVKRGELRVPCCHINRTMPPPPPPASGFASRLFLGPALRTQPDRRLVALVRDGYENAFEEIVRRYGGMLSRFAASIVPSHRAEDVTQDAFSKALLALRDTDKEIELRPWLFRIVRNTALNDLRDEPAYAEELSRPARRPQRPGDDRRAARGARRADGPPPRPPRAAAGGDRDARARGAEPRGDRRRPRDERRRCPPGDLPRPARPARRRRRPPPHSAPSLPACRRCRGRRRGRRSGRGRSAAGGALAGAAGGGAALKAGIATVVVAGSVTAGVAIDRDRPERAQADENRSELASEALPGRPAAAAAGRLAVATPVRAAPVRAAAATTAAGAATTTRPRRRRRARTR